jgi:hypothetical protein
VLLRPLLVVPHLGWLQLWGAIAVAAAVGNWFATLALGRAPEGLHVFLVGFLRYATHVAAYTLLLADPFPGFGGRRGFAVELADVPRERQRRWTVLLRAALALPAVLGAAVALLFSLLLAIVAWVAALALGRVPRALHAEFVWTLRFCVRTTAFALVLTDRYPRLSR